MLKRAQNRSHCTHESIVCIFLIFHQRFQFFMSSIHRIDGLEHKSKQCSKIFTTKLKSASLQNEKSADLSFNRENENLIDNLLNRVIR